MYLNIVKIQWKENVHYLQFNIYLATRDKNTTFANEKSVHLISAEHCEI